MTYTPYRQWTNISEDPEAPDFDASAANYIESGIEQAHTYLDILGEKDAAGGYPGLDARAKIPVERVYEAFTNAGARGVNTASNITSALQSVADSLPDGSLLVIPPGNYFVNGTVSFQQRRLTVLAWGCQFTQNASNAPVIDLNADANPDETNRKHNVRWFGGVFQSSTAAGSNTNIGIRARGLTRGVIAGVYGLKFGNCFIDCSVSDGFHLEDVHGADNYVDVRVPQYAKNPGNPQSISLKNCGFSGHLYAGVLIEKLANNFSIEDCYWNSHNAIVCATGTDTSVSGGTTDTYSRNLQIKKCTFEQGASGQFYIRTYAQNSGVMHNLTISECDFNDAPPKIADLHSVDGFVLEKSHVVSSASGYISVGANCKNVDIRSDNTLKGFREEAAAISAFSYACPASQVSFKGKSLQQRLDETLKTPALQNGVASYSPHGDVQFFKDGSGMVHMHGSIVSPALSTVAFTLPVGFRPSNTRPFSAITNTGAGRMHVEPDGTVMQVTGSTTWCSLANVHFKAA